MKKSFRIRILGYLSILLALAGLLFFRATHLATTGDQLANVGTLMLLCWGLAVLLAVGWFWWSVLDWFIRRKAAVTAAAIAQQVGRLAQPAGPAQGFLPAPAPSAPSSGSCATCGQPAASLYCTVHRAPLCPACAATHVQASAGPVPCLLAGVSAGAPAARPRPVVTSPLGLS